MSVIFPILTWKFLMCAMQCSCYVLKHRSRLTVTRPDRPQFLLINRLLSPSPPIDSL